MLGWILRGRRERALALALADSEAQAAAAWGIVQTQNATISEFVAQEKARIAELRRVVEICRARADVERVLQVRMEGLTRLEGRDDLEAAAEAVNDPILSAAIHISARLQAAPYGDLDVSALLALRDLLVPRTSAALALAVDSLFCDGAP